MPNIHELFPSRYVKASDLKGRDLAVVLANVRIEDVGGQNKPEDQCPVLYFQGMQKGLVLNKTNAATIASMFGAETEAWSGQSITLYPTEVQFGTNMVPAVRVRSQVGQPVQPAEAVTEAPVAF